MDICVIWLFLRLNDLFSMSIYKVLSYSLIVGTTLWFALSCQKNEQASISSFFENPRFKGDYSLTLDLLKPDSVVKHIRNEVPPKWYGLACETAYYHIKEGTPDSIILKHLDLYEQWFPHDTVFAFTKVLRSKVLLRRDRYDTAMTCLREAHKVCIKINSTYRLGDVAS